MNYQSVRLGWQYRVTPGKAGYGADLPYGVYADISELVARVRTNSWGEAAALSVVLHMVQQKKKQAIKLCKMLSSIRYATRWGLITLNPSTSGR